MAQEPEPPWTLVSTLDSNKLCDPGKALNLPVTVSKLTRLWGLYHTHSMVPMSIFTLKVLLVGLFSPTGRPDMYHSVKEETFLHPWHRRSSQAWDPTHATAGTMPNP